MAVEGSRRIAALAGAPEPVAGTGSADSTRRVGAERDERVQARVGGVCRRDEVADAEPGGQRDDQERVALIRPRVAARQGRAGPQGHLAASLGETILEPSAAG